MGLSLPYTFVLFNFGLVKREELSNSVGMSLLNNLTDFCCYFQSREI